MEFPPDSDDTSLLIKAMTTLESNRAGSNLFYIQDNMIWQNVLYKETTSLIFVLYR